jgi:hypothetical protein
LLLSLAAQEAFFPAGAKAPYHFAPGLTDGDKDYHLNHNTDSTCSFWEMMSCRFTIQALYSISASFLLKTIAHPSYSGMAQPLV